MEPDCAHSTLLRSALLVLALFTGCDDAGSGDCLWDCGVAFRIRVADVVSGDSVPSVRFGLNGRVPEPSGSPPDAEGYVAFPMACVDLPVRLRVESDGWRAAELEIQPVLDRSGECAQFIPLRLTVFLERQ